MRCPDHPRELVNLRCQLCHGELMSASELDTKLPKATALLSPAPTARVKERKCPQCELAMVPQRIGKAEAFVERCPSCESLWVEKSDLKTLELLSKSAARQAAFASMTDAEKRELAGGLAEATHVDTGPDVGVAQVALGVAGVPVVDRLQGDQPAIFTWVYAAALVLVHLVLGTQAYRVGKDGVLEAFVAGFSHFSWLHLIGNAIFLFVFGPAAEKKLPRWVFVMSILLLAPLTTLLQAAVASDSDRVAGASGVIASFIGMSLFLQPKARVLMVVRMKAFTIPLWLYALGWAAMQGLWWSLGMAGVGFLAHLSGFGVGLLIGFAFRSPKVNEKFGAA